MFICPKCQKKALEISAFRARCTSCNYSANSQDAADDYTRDVLKISYRDIAQGAAKPIYDCFSCGGGSTMVFDQDKGSFFCFSCGETWDTDDLDFCEKCATPHHRNDGMSICSNCYNESLRKD